MYKNFIETDSSINERIRKLRWLWTNKHICKYNLLQKAGTFLEILNHPGKVSTLLRVEELRCRKCILYWRKQMYVTSAPPIRAKFQNLRS